MKTKYKVVDNEFNRSNYPDLIDQVLDNPPAYANVIIVKEKVPMKDIFKLQNKMHTEEYTSDMLEDFVIKCLREGYEKSEIIDGIGQFFRQCSEVANNIFNRAIIKMKKFQEAESEGWYKKSQVDEVGPIKDARRFRASIYVDVFVPETDDLEKDREEARKKIEEYREYVPNSFIGGVAYYNPEKGFNVLDSEI